MKSYIEFSVPTQDIADLTYEWIYRKSFYKWKDKFASEKFQ